MMVNMMSDDALSLGIIYYHHHAWYWHLSFIWYQIVDNEEQNEMPVHINFFLKTVDSHLRLKVIFSSISVDGYMSGSEKF